MNSSCSSYPPPSASIQFIRSSAYSSSISIWQALNIFIISFLETLPELSASNSINILKYSYLVLRLAFISLIIIFIRKYSLKITFISSNIWVYSLVISSVRGVTDVVLLNCMIALSLVRICSNNWGWCDIISRYIGLIDVILRWSIMVHVIGIVVSSLI